MSRFSVRGLQQRPRQRGVALAVALILLLVITLVGLAAVSGTLMQQKMSANFYDRQVAFQSTEAAMRQAALAIQTATASAAAPAGFYDCSPAAPNTLQTRASPDRSLRPSAPFDVVCSSDSCIRTGRSRPTHSEFVRCGATSAR